MWNFKYDANDNDLIIYRNGKEIWCGSYEAFCADGDVTVPSTLARSIHKAAEAAN